jgi:hypothetical protein
VKIKNRIQSHKKENLTLTKDTSVIEIIDKAGNNFKLMLKEMIANFKEILNKLFITK